MPPTLNTSFMLDHMSFNALGFDSVLNKNSGGVSRVSCLERFQGVLERLSPKKPKALSIVLTFETM